MTTSEWILVIWGYIRVEIEDVINVDIATDIKQLIAQFSRPYFDSKILSLNEQLEFIELLSQNKLTDIKRKQVQLLYRASEHNYLADKFHELCNGHAPTLVVIQNNFGHVFGGYTTIKWQSTPTTVGGRDENAFLFLIRSSNANERVPMIFDCVHPNTAVFHSNTRGPVFGQGADISIADKCNHAKYDDLEYGSRCYGWKAKNQGTYAYQGNQLCGGDQKCINTYYFAVEEYEVFEIK
eukprot:253879_1